MPDLFAGTTLVAGTMQSAELTDVGDLVIDAELSQVQTQGLSFTYRIIAKEAGMTRYKPVSGEKQIAITASRSGNGDYRESIVAVNAASVYLEIDVPAGAAGTVTAKATHSANPLSA